MMLPWKMETNSQWGLVELCVSKDIAAQIGLVVEIDMIALDIALSLLAMDTVMLLQASSQVLVETMGLFAFYIAV